MASRDADAVKKAQAAIRKFNTQKKSAAGGSISKRGESAQARIDRVNAEAMGLTQARKDVVKAVEDAQKAAPSRSTKDFLGNWLSKLKASEHIDPDARTWWGQSDEERRRDQGGWTH